MRYTSSITAGSLKVPESRVIAGLMLRGLKGKAFQQAISGENVLQARSKNTSQGLAKLIRRRLQHLPEPMLKLVRDGSVIEATHACLAAAIMDSFLLGDFLDLVMRPLYRTFKENLPLSSWRDYLEGCQGREERGVRGGAAPPREGRQSARRRAPLLAARPSSVGTAHPHHASRRGRRARDTSPLRPPDTTRRWCRARGALRRAS